MWGNITTLQEFQDLDSVYSGGKWSHPSDTKHYSLDQSFLRMQPHHVTCLPEYSRQLRAAESNYLRNDCCNCFSRRISGIRDENH